MPDSSRPPRAAVDPFWRAGIEAGYTDDGRPGPRPEYGDDYYGGFLLDPDGTNVESVHHGPAWSRGAACNPELHLGLRCS